MISLGGLKSHQPLGKWANTMMRRKPKYSRGVPRTRREYFVEGGKNLEQEDSHSNALEDGRGNLESFFWSSQNKHTNN
jgi:hypothetical protein